MYYILCPSALGKEGKDTLVCVYSGKAKYKGEIMSWILSILTWKICGTLKWKCQIQSKIYESETHKGILELWILEAICETISSGL